MMVTTPENLKGLSGLYERLREEWLREPFSYHPLERIPSSDYTRLLSPSVRRKPDSAIRPRLRNDATFFQSMDGVMLRSDRQSFFLRGDAIHPILSALAPWLTGEYTLEELGHGLAPECRRTLSRIVRLLVEGGILKDQMPEESHGLSDAVRLRFRAQLELLDHLADRPLERFARFRRSRVLLAGSQQSFADCAGALMSYGLAELFALPLAGSLDELAPASDAAEEHRRHGVEARVHVLNSPDADSGAPALQDFSLVIYCAGPSSLSDLLLLNRACCQEGVAFLPGLVLGNQSVMGPLIKAMTPGCWICGLFRIIEGIEEEGRRSVFEKFLREWSPLDSSFEPSPAAARELGGDLAFEAFKLLAGGVRQQTDEGMLLQVVDGDASFDARVMRHALCACMESCVPFSRGL